MYLRRGGFMDSAQSATIKSGVESNGEIQRPEFSSGSLDGGVKDVGKSPPQDKLRLQRKGSSGCNPFLANIDNETVTHDGKKLALSINNIDDDAYGIAPLSARLLATGHSDLK